MATDKTLNAVLSGEETISGDLGEIATTAFGAAEGFDAIQDNSTGAATGIDAVGVSAAGLDDELGDVLGGSTEANAGLDALGDQAVDTALDFETGEAVLGSYDESLGDTTTTAIEAAGANEAVGHAIDNVGDQARASTGEIIGYRAALHTLPSALTTTLSARRGEVPSLTPPGRLSAGVDVESPESLGLPRVPDRQVSVGAATPTGLGLPDVSDLQFDVDADTTDAVAGIDAVEEAADTLSNDETVAYAARTDPPSFATAEGYADALSEQEWADYTARVGGASFANAHAAADGLPDEESTLYSALTDATSFTEAAGTADALSGNEQVAYEAAIDQASFAGVEGVIEGVATDEDLHVGVEPDADMGRFEGVKASITGLFGDESVEVFADTDEASFAAAQGLISTTIPAEKEVSIRADVNESSFAAAREMARIGGRDGDSGGGLSGGFLGVRGGLGTVGALAATALPPVAALGGALGGVAAAGAGVGVGVAGILGGGVLDRAHELVGTTVEINGEMKELKTTGDAVKYIFSGIKDQAGGMLDPLENAQTGDIFEGLVGSGLTVFEDGVSMVSNLMPDIVSEGEDLSEVFGETEPQGFSELEGLTRDTLPYLEDFGEFTLRTIPKGLAWMRKEAVPLLPILGDLGEKGLGAAVELAELGGTVLHVVGPPLAWTLGLVETGLDLFNDLPGPVKEAAIAGTALGGAAYFLAAGETAAMVAGQGLFYTLGALTAPISGTALAIGVAVGAVAAIISYMGWWDDIMGAIPKTIKGLQKTWNGAIDVMVGGTNVLHGAIETMVNGAAKGINILLKAWNAIPGHKDTKLLSTDFDIPDANLDKYKTDVDGNLGVADAVGSATEEVLGGGSGDNGGDGDGSPPSPPPVSGGQTIYEGDTNYNFGDIDASGGDTTEERIKSVAKQAIAEEDSGSDRHQRKRSNPTG